MVSSAKRTELLIVTVRFLVFDREPYRTKTGAVWFAVQKKIVKQDITVIYIIFSYIGQSASYYSQ
jgi:hypothetical protein